MFELRPDGILVTAKLSLHDHIELENGIKTIQDFCAAMMTEPGCLFAFASREIKSARSFILWEQYADETAISAHFKAPHTQSFIEADICTLDFSSQSSIALGAK